MMLFRIREFCAQPWPGTNLFSLGCSFVISRKRVSNRPVYVRRRREKMVIGLQFSAFLGSFPSFGIRTVLPSFQGARKCPRAVSRLNVLAKIRSMPFLFRCADSSPSMPGAPFPLFLILSITSSLVKGLRGGWLWVGFCGVSVIRHAPARPHRSL